MGYLSEEELKYSPGIPAEARRQNGPVASIECLEDIPCNPCETSCNFDAIIVGEDITNIPHLDGDKCVACQTCVYICPGQAIFMIDESLPEGKASVMMPYEYRPLPEKGDVVTALDRAGQELGDAKVIAPAGKGRCRHGPGSGRTGIGRCKSYRGSTNQKNGSDCDANNRGPQRLVHAGQSNSIEKKLVFY
jgi:Fe-S-cluster-containing hydrogenase component 2